MMVNCVDNLKIFASNPMVFAPLCIWLRCVGV